MGLWAGGLGAWEAGLEELCDMVCMLDNLTRLVCAEIARRPDARLVMVPSPKGASCQYARTSGPRSPDPYHLWFAAARNLYIDHMEPHLCSKSAYRISLWAP